MSTPLTMLALAFFDGVAAGTEFAATSDAALLVDGGPSGGALLRALPGSLLRGDRSINPVVATHPQADHITGLSASWIATTWAC